MPDASIIRRHNLGAVWHLENMPARMRAASVVYTRITAIGAHGGRHLEEISPGSSQLSAVGAI